MREGPGDSKDPRDTEVRMGGTGDKQNELNEFAIKFWAYLILILNLILILFLCTEQSMSLRALSCLYFRESVLRTRSWLKFQQRPSTQTQPYRDKASPQKKGK